MAGRSPYVIQLSTSERATLVAKAGHRKSQHREVTRSSIVLLAAEGMDNTAIGKRLGLDRQVVSRWRKRFFEGRFDGLQERPRSGRPRRFSP